MGFQYDPADPPGPLTVIRAILGAALLAATAALGIAFVTTGHLETHTAAAIGMLWIFWGLFHDIFAVVAAPLAGWVGGQLTAADEGPAPHIDIDQETMMLERLLADPPAVPHREILAGIRLAEIYRTHQHDLTKSQALLARLRAKYPDARELQLADGIA